MRFVHTADWHLGRLFHGRHLTEDQAVVLERLVDLLRDAKAEALVIAGDVYDRAVPPVEAVRLLDDVLTRVRRDVGIPVILIAGNHDAPDRIGFGARLLAGEGLHVFGRPGEAPGAVDLRDGHGPVRFHALPYAEPALVREATGNEEVHTHDAAFREVLARARRDGGARHVLVAHAFVAGATESDSERPLSVGGSGAVGADALAGFDYVALGHLHRPQRAGSECARYAGSLLKYSFSEADHRKGVLVVEMGRAGDVTVEPGALPPRHDVRILEGTLTDLIERPDLPGPPRRLPARAPHRPAGPLRSAREAPPRLPQRDAGRAHPRAGPRGSRRGRPIAAVRWPTATSSTLSCGR